MQKPSPFKVSILEAFCDERTKGNPAGVMLMERFPDDFTLQRIAEKVNLSETAYLAKKEKGLYALRWFTPSCEVELCGHATLAATHFLYEQFDDLANTISFVTHAGRIKAHRLSERRYEIDFPRDVLTEVESLHLFEEILGCRVIDAYRGKEDYVIVLSTEEELIKLQPNFEKMKRKECRGFIVTTKSVNGEFDFISRFFAPNAGIHEDPVTGSAHCTLAEYWKTRLHKTTMRAYQASTRGGVVQIRTNEKKTHLEGEVRYLECLEVKL